MFFGSQINISNKKKNACEVSRNVIFLIFFNFFLLFCTVVLNFWINFTNWSEKEGNKHWIGCLPVDQLDQYRYYHYLSAKHENNIKSWNHELRGDFHWYDPLLVLRTTSDQNAPKSSQARITRQQNQFNQLAISLLSHLNNGMSYKRMLKIYMYPYTGGYQGPAPLLSSVTHPSISQTAITCFTKSLMWWVWWGRCKKTISRRRKEGRVEKKSARSAPARPGARTRNLPCARRGSPAARHGGCLDKQAFPCL